MRMYITDFINFIIRPVGSMVVISNREPVIKSSWPTFRIQQDVYWLEWAGESVSPTQLYQVNFQWDDDEVRFVLDQHA
jgi:hypothetical protein